MNWYKTAKIKESQVQGEFWIDEYGGVIGADGDVNDYNHEGYVMQSVLGKYDLDYDHNMIDINDPSFIKDLAEEEFEECLTYMKNNNFITEEEYKSYIVNAEEGVNEIINNLTTRDALLIKGMTEEEADIASGYGDGRLYAIKEWGWKRLEGNNIETWSLTSSDMSTIADGLWEAYDSEAEKALYNIHVYGSNKWYNDVPYIVLSSAKPSALREYDSHVI